MQKLLLCLLVGCAFVFLSGCTTQEIKQTLQNTDLLMQNHNYRDALLHLDQALVTHPQQTKLLEKKAELLILTEQYDQFLELRPRLPRATQKRLHRSSLIALMKTGESSEAGAQIDGLLATKPTSDLHQLKGQTLALQGKTEEAIISYDKALRLDPNNQDAEMNKAIALADAGNLYESLALFDQLLLKHPDEYLLRYNKGTVLSDLGYQQRNIAGTGSFSYYGDALRHFEKAYKLNPHFQNNTIWLGISYLDLSQYKKAHQVRETVLSADPHAYDAWYYLAKTYTAEGNIAQAKKTYSHLLEINPDFLLAQQELLLLDQGTPQE